MIIVKNAEFAKVSTTIDIEKTYIQNLLETLTMIRASDKDVLAGIDDYIKHNAVFNGIATHVNRNISSRHTLFDALVFSLNNALVLQDAALDILKKANKKVFDTNAITYKEKGVFDWLNAISFFVNYSSKLIDVILTQPKNIAAFLTKADFEFLNKTVNYYNTLLKRLSDSPKNLQNSLKMLSDEQYDVEFTDIITRAKGKEATTVGLSPHELNPDFWRRYLVMRWDVRTLKSNQEKIDMYASKLQRLENKRTNAQDPSLDHQIEQWQNEIQILDAENRELEAKYAD